MKPSATPLKQALLNEYGSFSDRRIKNLEKGSEFDVDDRSAGGLGSGGIPYGWFCTISADVVDAHTVRVSLGNSIHKGRSVTAWAAKNGIALSDRSLQFDVTPDNIDLLTGLADAFLDIIKPGVRYNDAPYKYACPRTASSLKRLASVLDSAWSGG